ncbi:uncharacterized protein RCC_02333 [Ramularia collo-cygni]|uniref:HRQ family protein 2 n=1 Tax=Ramularia collo-cygni TaxID=112498 RepID=A0A2D3UU99_9PEZI|nr:uncharacterized protein RCC_02333 [Ramularia collo-cygni]CZT16490.1 uncharacterized protein RCC_02333 [Ramularia collo-cygni]
MIPNSVIAAFAGLALFVLWRLYKVLCQQRQQAQQDSKQCSEQAEEKNPYTNIEPLPDFKWAETPPIRNANLKPKYHLTMALENVNLSETIALDNTYADRMKFRRSTIDKNPDATMQCNPVGVPAVLELHDWIFRTYLPTRFPSIYHLTPENSLFNTVSNTSVPLVPASPLRALDALGEHVDTDFVLLLPTSKAADGSPIYHLQAFVCCCPMGFSLRQKSGMPLAEIHSPVPGYKAKLEKSMDRFFARLECAKPVKRSNWTITTDDVLFKEDGTHFHSPSYEDESEEIKQQRRDVVVENCRLRSERQILFRLPNTKAIVFAFKTYLYKLSEAKEEGYAEALADAIEGLKTGNVPEMNHYKRGTVWAEPVVDYLRG